MHGQLAETSSGGLSPGQGEAADGRFCSAPGGLPDSPPSELWRDALRMWLAWSDAEEQVTAQFYQDKSDLPRMADLLDQLDQLRWRATELSRELLAART